MTLLGLELRYWIAGAASVGAVACLWHAYRLVRRWTGR